MTVDEMYRVISKEEPAVVYVSGKTSTGKSTFGRKLRDDLGYQVIELEAVLLDIVKTHGFDEQLAFRKVLHDAEDSEEKTLFVEATDRIISDALTQGRPAVIEGAVANGDTLLRVLQPAANLFFLYFHPANIDIYIRNLTNRFMESGEESYGGLPPTFWRLVDDEEFKTFCKTRKLTDGLRGSIEQYARASQKESLTRLNEFRQKFGNVTLVEIQ